MQNEVIAKILEKEQIQYETITKSTSGFTNDVYFVDDKFVIKVVAARTKNEKLEKEIQFYLNTDFDFVPKYVASGVCDGITYLIISKLPGDSLYSIWHTLDVEKRKHVVLQICKILNKFHIDMYKFLPTKYVYSDWAKKWNDSFIKNISIMKEKGFDVDFLEEFRQTRLPKIMESQDPCLVYNDAHFDNFLLDGDKVYLIDFDRVLYGSVDYELLIIKSMLDAPHKFASEVDEPNVVPEHYVGIWETLMDNCPQMFKFEYIKERVFIYQFVYNLGNAYEWNHDDWVANELDKFKNFFDIK